MQMRMIARTELRWRCAISLGLGFLLSLAGCQLDQLQGNQLPAAFTSVVQGLEAFLLDFARQVVAALLF